MTARPQLQILPNAAYRHPRLDDMVAAGDCDSWSFSCGNVQGIRLSNACASSPSDIDGYADLLLPFNCTKVTCVIALRGYKPYRRVKNVQSVRGGVPQPVPRHRVVRCIAQVFRTFLEQAQTTEDYVKAPALVTADLKLEDFYLLELRRVGKTLIPVLGYIPLSGSLPVKVESCDDWVDAAFAAALGVDCHAQSPSNFDLAVLKPY
ncbi:hypothetical protein PsYK624_045570 [Phanerochaete sordida]|uniref:Uncharacterized protein n=1 Tax=Phanerochaete sordida TaxID=48140 RepID=A0A9P3G6P7_9APHY|nr:hypothetical protein PsYK624_045570 [Phanerochaete sordida]